MSTAAASTALRGAWARVTGENADEKTVALLTAQWAHETAHGASMYNYNFGGIKGTGPSGLSVEQRTKEGWGRHEHQIIDHFRAYETAESGAEDYVELLTQRFPEAVKAARDGDAEGFVHGLKQRGYFTGDEHAYQRSVSSLSNEFLSTSSQSLPTTEASRSHAISNVNTRSVSASHEQPSASVPSQPARSLGYAQLVQPLMPTVLMGALAESTNQERESLGMLDGAPLGHVSTSAMVDEILRASLQMSSTPSRELGRAGDGT